jgi:hypothetical protein
MSIGPIVLVIMGALLLVVLALTVVLSLGVYLGWFGMGSGRTAPERDFRFTLDEDMIKNDSKSAPSPRQEMAFQNLDNDMPGIPAKKN